jgi:membrane protein DedA with SNARE-associated domain
VFALGLIGREVGHNWTQWKDALHYVDYVVAVAIVLLILWAIMRWWRRRGQGEPAADIAA